MAQTSHEQALSKAKIALMSTPDSAFFTYLAFSLKHEFTEACHTARTDGLVVQYNPKFFMDLTPEERVFLMLHESMHCAYLHMERADTFDKQRYNKAADHVINLQLIDRGFKMPSMGLADPAYKDKSTEEVYYLLPPEEEGNGGNWGIGEDLQDPAGAPGELQQQVQDILVQAAIQSKMANDSPGTIPGDIQIFLDKLLNPKLPWQKILQKYVQQYSKSDYSFKRPNRRFFPAHYLPSMHNQSLISMALFVDTSGSVSDQDFRQFISETHGILRMMKPAKITVGQFDTQIKAINEVRDVRDLMNVKFTGRGGTDITEVVEWANKNKPQLLLMFTDGEFHFPQIETKSNVLWMIHNNPGFEAPYGKVIHYEL
jgi:predicted metal-dependent peptidase